MMSSPLGRPPVAPLGRRASTCKAGSAFAGRACGSLTLSAALQSLLIGLSAASAQPTTPAGPTFGCDAPGGRTCYFSVEAPGGVQNFSLPAGARRVMPGLVAGRDSYVVSIGAPNFSDVRKCRAIAALGGRCARKIVAGDYND